MMLLLLLILIWRMKSWNAKCNHREAMIRVRGQRETITHMEKKEGRWQDTTLGDVPWDGKLGYEEYTVRNHLDTATIEYVLYDLYICFHRKWLIANYRRIPLIYRTLPLCCLIADFQSWITICIIRFILFPIYLLAYLRKFSLNYYLYYIHTTSWMIFLL